MRCLITIRRLLVLFMFCLLTSCSPATPLNLLARSGAWTLSTQHYGSGPRHGLDIFTPAGARNAPVVVFFYGGNWQSGDKDTYRFVGASLADRGYVAVIPDYRVYPEVRFAGFMHDGAQAVAWVKRKIGRFGGDPNRVFLAGHSAGAHIAAMLTLDEHWLANVGLDSRRDIASLIGVAGPYDFLPLHDDTLKIIFSGGDLKRTQPIDFVSGHEPAAFLVAGRRDEIVDPGNTTRLAARLRANGDEVTAIEYPGIGHMAIVGAFAPVLRPLAPLLKDIDAFIAAHAGSRREAKQYENAR